VAVRPPLRDGFLLAAGTLTTFRVPAPRRVDRATAGVAMALAPAVGALVAVPPALVAVLGRAAGTGDLPAAALAIGTLAWLTGGLHLDGLADTTDGLAAGRGDRTRALEVMRRGDIGPLGAVALVVVILIQVVALGRALAVAGPWALPAAAAAGRAVLPVLCARGIPSARPDGLGATVAGSVPRAVALLVAVLVAALAALVAGPAGPDAERAALAVAAGCAVGAVVAGRAVRRLGGITGDVLGAGVEWGTTTALVVLALAR
jgi:adenosylcobinamide-GDP ribazoletransferase